MSKRSKLIQEEKSFKLQLDKIDEALKKNAENIKKTIKIDRNQNLPVGSWVFNSSLNIYVFTLGISGITSNTVVDINIHLASLNDASGLTPIVESFDGYIKIYAYEKPTKDILCDIIYQNEVI